MPERFLGGVINYYLKLKGANEVFDNSSELLYLKEVLKHLSEFFWGFEIFWFIEIFHSFEQVISSWVYLVFNKEREGESEF